MSAFRLSSDHGPSSDIDINQRNSIEKMFKEQQLISRFKYFSCRLFHIFQIFSDSFLFWAHRQGNWTCGSTNALQQGLEQVEQLMSSGDGFVVPGFTEDASDGTMAAMAGDVEKMGKLWKTLWNRNGVVVEARKMMDNDGTMATWWGYNGIPTTEIGGTLW